MALPASAGPPVSKRLDSEGRGAITVNSSFRLEHLLAMEFDEEVADRYCEIYRGFSRNLWIATEGQHYLERARFYVGAANADIIWGGSHETANASYLGRIHMPGPSAKPNVDDHGDVLLHEFFHFLYNLPDEYLQYTPSWGEQGFCADLTGEEYAEAGHWFNVVCTSLPESSCGDASCLKSGSCWGGTHDGLWCADTSDEPIDPGLPVVLRAQCEGAGGQCIESSTCLIDQVGKVCESDTDCGVGFCAKFPELTGEAKICYIPGGDTCNMTNYWNRDRLCNEHTHRDQNEDGLSLMDKSAISVDAVYEGYIDSFEKYNCWDFAAIVHPDLEVPADYTPVEMLGEPPPMACEWFVDDVLIGDELQSAVVAVDLSGSMLKKFKVDSKLRAWRAAVDAAEFYRKRANQMPGAYIGVYGFHVDFMPLKIEGSLIDLVLGPAQEPWPKSIDKGTTEAHLGTIPGDDNYDPDNPDHPTDLCEPLRGALQAYAEADPPLQDRNLILLTDGRHSVTPEWLGDGLECDPPALAAELCAAGIKVHVAAYGDFDADMVAALAEAGCGDSYHVPTEPGGLTEPHALQFGLGSMHTRLASDVTIWELRAPLTSKRHQVHALQVPAASERLTIAAFGDANTFPGADPDLPEMFNNLHLRVVSPGGKHHHFEIGELEVAARFRQLVIDAPEAGTWQVHIDASEIPDSYRSTHTVGWIAGVRHPHMHADAWVDAARYEPEQPVTLRAMLNVLDPLTDITAVAMLAVAGEESTLELFDDGLHGAPEPGTESMESGSRPRAWGVHVIRVDFHAKAGLATTVPGEPVAPDAVIDPPIILGRDFTAAEHVAFEVRRVDPLTLDTLLQRLAESGTWLGASPSGAGERMATVGSPSGSEGPDEIACLTPKCRALGRGGDDMLVAEPMGDVNELHGGAGIDLLFGGEGSDILIPGAEPDLVVAGGGDDFVIIRNSCELQPGESLSGGEGYDVLVLPPGADLEQIEISGFELTIEDERLLIWAECQ
ncbi:MAG: hypothetical protein HC927_00300 [Deltaproteobacteria bacterium]|nr:hypothetical protein [Deltaproteobacteria bacterium]